MTTLQLGGRPQYGPLLQQLEEMGWSTSDAHNALQATGARNLAAAIDWLVERGPLSAPQEPPPAGGGGASFMPMPQTTAMPPADGEETVVATTPSRRDSQSEKEREWEQQERKKELIRAQEEKRAKKEEERRVKALLRETQLDRARKYNRGRVAPAVESTQAATTNPTANQRPSASVSSVSLLQIRLPTGATLKQQFSATDTIGTLYDFVARSMGRDTSNLMIMQPGIPKTEWPLEISSSTTLAQAQLVPRGSVIVMNKEDKGVVRGAEAEVDPIEPFRLRAGHFGGSAEDSIDSDSLTYEELLELEERMGEVGKGVSKEDLDALPTFQFDPSQTELMKGDTTCAICLLDYDTGNELRKLPCGHAFHKECIDVWLEARKTCPTCKQRIDELGDQIPEMI